MTTNTSGLAAVALAAAAPAAPAAVAPAVTFTQAQYDEAVAAARTEGEAAGATAERARILGIEAALIPGHEALVAQFKADGKTTAGEAALAINAAEAKLRGGALAGLRADGAALPAVPAAAVAQPPAAAVTAEQILADRSKPVEERCKAAWDADPKIRDQHATVGRFTAYQAAVESGAVRQLRNK